MNKKLYSFLKQLSVNTWERIEFVRKSKNLKIGEVTLTQNLLFNLNKFGAEFSNIVIFEAVNEKKNGNDIELYIETKKGYVFFAIQAKIIDKKSNKFKEIFHKKGGQLSDLKTYAINMQGLPFYMLYSYLSGSTYKTFGCSLLFAKYVEDFFAKPKKYPHFNDVIPTPAFPFQEVLRLKKITNEIIEFKDPTFNNIAHDYEIKYYKSAELVDDKNWVNINSNKEFKSGENIIGNDEKFSPMYRILLKAKSQKIT